MATPDCIIALPDLNFRLELVRVPAGPFTMGGDGQYDGTPDGGLCGTWVTKDDTLVVEVTGVLGEIYKTLE